ITRYDLPPADGSDGPTIDVRDEVRGRFGDTGPHELLDSELRNDGSGAGAVDEAVRLPDHDDDFSLGDGFDDLTIGELVVVDPAGVDGPPVGRYAPAAPADPGHTDPDADAELEGDEGASEPIDPYIDYGRRQPSAEASSRNDAFRTAFGDDPAVTASHPIERRPVRRWLGPALAGLLALAIVGAAIALLLTSGVLSSEPAVELTGSTEAVVGDYVGLTVPEAQVEAEANGWELNVSERREDGSEAGVITRQLPAAGETLAEGRTLVVEVSLGPELHTVPRVVGLTVDEAAAVLQRSGLQ
ncbi:MAG: PASTA domain-containing protein, partial [Actinomycetota bacterium]